MYYFTMYFSRCVRNGNGETRVKKYFESELGTFLLEFVKENYYLNFLYDTSTFVSILAYKL